jgi:lipoprotein-anchoring transpeptidase ErfK/SrfK
VERRTGRDLFSKVEAFPAPTDPVRRPAIIAIASALTVLLLAAGVAWGVDRAHRETIAKGVTVGGIDVGGLDRDAAHTKLQRELVDQLSSPIVLQHGTRTWQLGARESQVAVDIDGSVDAAIAHSRQGNFLGRTVDRITGAEKPKRVGADVTYNDHAVVRLLDRVRGDIERAPRDASVEFGPDSISPVPSRDGLTIHATGLHRRIRNALVAPHKDHLFRMHLKRITPKVTTAELGHKYPTLITVDRSGFRLRLFKNLELVKTYKIAVGRQGLETPAGLYAIQDKQVNPAWHVPDSDWAGKLRGKVIPPGPGDPLKARWMGLFGGAGIHGVDPSEYGSLGSAASHGCVRMRIPDVIELYRRVRVGTPVYIA